MGLNPTILRQVRAFALAVSPSEPPAVPRRRYRASGFVLALQPASANAATARMTRKRMGAFQLIGDEPSDNRLVDTQEKSAIRFSFLCRTRAVWLADRRLTLQSRHNIAGIADHWITDSVPNPNFGGATHCPGRRSA